MTAVWFWLMVGGLLFAAWGSEGERLEELQAEEDERMEERARVDRLKEYEPASGRAPAHDTGGASPLPRVPVPRAPSRPAVRSGGYR